MPGLTFRMIVSAAAPPIAISISAALASPDNALTLAVPDWLPACRSTVTLPLSVRASLGSIVPRVIVKVTTVPVSTGVPLCSMIVAVISVKSSTGSTRRLAARVMVDSVGAEERRFVVGTLHEGRQQAHRHSIDRSPTDQPWYHCNE